MSARPTALTSRAQLRDARKGRVAIGIALVAVLAALLAYLQHNAALQAELAGRLAQQYSIQALGQRAAGQAAESYGLATASAWYELGKLAATASRAGNADGVQRYRQAQEQLAQISPLLTKTYDFDVRRYAADLYITRTVKLAERADIAAQTSAAWGARQTAYLSAMLLLAAALGLLGLSLTVQGRSRNLLAISAGAAAALALLHTGVTLAAALPARPAGAAQAYARGVGLAWQGATQQAIEEFNLALQQAPNYASALLARGNAFYAQGDDQRAIADYLRAQQAGRDDAIVAWNLGTSYYRLGRFDDAIRANQHALELKPDLQPARFSLALSLLAAGQLDEARASYTAAQAALAAQAERARSDDPSAPYAYWQDLERAAQDVDDLLDLLSNNTHAWTQAPPRAAIANLDGVAAAARQIVVHLKNLNTALEYTGLPPQEPPSARVSDFIFSAQQRASQPVADSGGAELEVSAVQPRAPYEAARPVDRNPQTFYPRASASDIATAAGDITDPALYARLTGAPQDQLDALLLLFRYDRMRDGQPVLWKVYTGGAEVLSLRAQQIWSLGGQGNAQKGFTFIVSSPGEYSVEMYVDYHLVRRGRFTVTEPVIPDPAGSAVVSSTLGLSVISDDPALAFQDGRLTRIGLGVLMQAAWSPNSAQVAVATSIGIYLLDAATLNLQRFIESDQWITPVQYLPDGKTLLAGSANGTIIAYDTASGTAARTIDAHNGQVLRLAYNARANLIASVGDDLSIKLWDGDTGAPRGQLDGHTDEITAIAFNGNGTQLASGSRDQTVRVWDTRASAPLLTIQTGAAVLDVALSPNGQRLAVAGAGTRAVNVYSTATTKLAFSLTTANPNVDSVTYTSDGSRLVTAGDGGVAQVWNADGGALTPLRELKGSARIVRAEVSADGKSLLTLDDSRAVAVWELATGKTTAQPMVFGAYMNALAFTPDGSGLAIGDHAGIVEVRDVGNGFILAGSLAHDMPVTSLAFNPTLNQIATAGQDKLVKLWDSKFANLQFALAGHEDNVASIAYSADGALLASGSWDRSIKLWDARSGALLNTLNGHAFEVLSVAFSPDGKRMVSGSRDKTVKVWDVATGDLLGTLEGHADTVLAVAYSPDGRYLASAGVDEFIRVWDAQNGALLRIINDGNGVIFALAFSPDSARIASGGADPDIKVWDVVSSQRVAVYSGHTWAISGLDFSPDGLRLASSSIDGTARLWSVK